MKYIIIDKNNNNSIPFLFDPMCKIQIGGIIELAFTDEQKPLNGKYKVEEMNCSDDNEWLELNCTKVSEHYEILKQRDRMNDRIMNRRGQIPPTGHLS